MRATTSTLLLLGVLMPHTGFAGALRDWMPAQLEAKHAIPAHLAAYAQLPSGSVTVMQAAAPSKSGQPPTLTLPDGETIAWQVVQRISHPGGNISYIAEGTQGGYAVFTAGEHAGFGHLQTPNGVFRFESWGDQGWLVDIAHPDLRIEAADRGVRGKPIGDPVAPPAAPVKSVPVTALSGAAKNHTPAIDVLFLYSDGFAARYPGSAAQTRIDHLLAIANLSLANSRAPLVVRRAGALQNGYPDSEGSNEVALDWMHEALAGRSTVPAFSSLRTQRQNAGADLVVLLRPHDIETRGSCGIAMFPTGLADVGVHVVSDGFSSWSLCDDDVFTHELGHNLGAEHQDGANSPNAGFGTAFVLSTLR